MHEGHRQRMLERLEHAEESLCDHELLEILLFNAIPRKNTNEIAHELLSAFGSLAEVFRADMTRLKRVNGVGESTAAYLRCIGLLCEKADFSVDPPPKTFNVSTFIPYLKQRFSGLTEEVVELFALDSRDCIRSSARFTSGKKESALVSPEEISSFLIEQKPVGIVVAHNHLDGNCNPSRSDDIFTAKLHVLCTMNRTKLFDHIILAGDEFYSYFSKGDLFRIRDEYTLENLFGSADGN